MEDEVLEVCEICQKTFVQKYWDDEIESYVEINLEKVCVSCGSL